MKTSLMNSPDYKQKKKRIETNEKIQDARMAALKILKPTSKELEHGLELQANSVVVESEGPRLFLKLDT